MDKSYSEEVETPSSTPSQTTRVPLVEERVYLEKHLNASRVRVRTIVEQQPVVLSEELALQAVDVERVPVGMVVETAPAVRQEGDTVVIPVLEERLVTRKELVLVEEVRVRLVKTHETVTASETRRVMHAVVERQTDPTTNPAEAEP